MGLDMYLNKRTYIGNQYRDVEKQVKIIIPSNQEGVLFPTEKINSNRISEIIEEVGYWRKANQIHNWFVENVQNGEDDCKEYYVSKDNLNKLLELCKKIKNKELDPEEALPTQEGFFFGSTEYDEYYMDDIDNTISIIEDIFTNYLNEDGDLTGSIYYNSSW